MSSVGINFGSATSGSGFDVTSTVNSIMAVERTPETAWAAQTTALQAQDTVLTTLGSNVSSLSTALSSLTSFDGVFAQMQGASSNSGVVALTSVGSTAQSGSHTLSVSQLATTAQQYSSAVSASATMSGTLTLQTESADSPTLISITSGSTLTQVATQINNSNAGVQATVLSDSGGQYLSITSKTSGAAGDLTITSDATDSSGNPLSFTSNQQGRDAQYKLDGVNLTSGSNSVTGSLPGVALQLTGVSSGDVTVQIAPDESGIASALQSFVSAYNTLATALTSQEGKSSSGSAQPLFGSTIVSQIQSSLSAAFAFSPSSASGVSLTSLGLSLAQDGTLSLDTGVLGTALASNFSMVADSFLVTKSFGQNFTTALNSIGNTGTGTIAMALSNNSSEETTLANNKTALEARLTTYSANLTTQLNTANAVLQAIPQQLNEVNQIFYSISGYQSSSKG